MLTNEELKGNLAENRFKIDSKLVGILSVFALMGIILLLVVILAANTISSLRSYATLHTHWTEARKEAVIKLGQFIHSGEQSFFEDFKGQVKILQNAEKARVELVSEHTDPKKVIVWFEPFQLKDSEIVDMVKTYERVGSMQEFAGAIASWKSASRAINRLDSLANQIKERINPESINEARTQWLQEVEEIDRSITKKQYAIAGFLADGTNRLQNLILWSSVSIGLILFLIGGFMASRFLKSLHRWEQALNLNKQRYQSLFDQNPNAVCSFNIRGEFIEGNESLYKLLKISENDLKGMNYEQFILSAERERVIPLNEQAAAGNPQTYETIVVDTEGEKVPVQITNLPIYAADKIVGVYVIAQNINDRVIAEQKLQKQLKERTLLLEEIHHRVKNNLALISGMLML